MILACFAFVVPINVSFVVLPDSVIGQRVDNNGNFIMSSILLIEFDMQIMPQARSDMEIISQTRIDEPQ